MKNDNNLTSGVYQNSSTPNGNWDILKTDSSNLLNNIKNTIENIVDSDNEKVKGYKNSLKNLSTKIENFNSKISTKNGEVKPSEDEYGTFLESRYYLEKENSELTLLCNTVKVLEMTEEM